MSPTEWVTTVKDVLLGAAAATTAIVAIIGLDKWRKELEGKTGFEAARGLIKATYKLRNQLQICRSPLYSALEFPADYKGGLGCLSKEEETKAWVHIYKNRWDPVWIAIQDFDTQTLEAEALWGTGIRTKTDALRQCVRELNIAIESVINDKANGGENFKADKEFAKSMRSIVAAGREDDKNEFNQKIAQAIFGIEDEIRPHLRRA